MVAIQREEGKVHGVRFVRGLCQEVVRLCSIRIFAAQQHHDGREFRQCQVARRTQSSSSGGGGEPHDVGPVLEDKSA